MSASQTRAPDAAQSPGDGEAAPLPGSGSVRAGAGAEAHARGADARTVGTAAESGTAADLNPGAAARGAGAGAAAVAAAPAGKPSGLEAPAQTPGGEPRALKAEGTGDAPPATGVRSATAGTNAAATLDGAAEPTAPATRPGTPGGASAPALDWRDGGAGAVPVSPLYDDPYYSLSDGLAETRHTYIDAAALPARMTGADAFRIGELGFGAGLALLAAWSAWLAARAPGGVLRFTSFELHPIAPADMARAHAAFPELAPLSALLVPAWAEATGPVRRIALEGLSLTVHIGDARQTLPRTRLLAQAWFLDGFAPARNPALWDPALLAAVARRTAPGGTASTYSAAGHVRRALSAAGFEVTKARGFGTKRHMSVARLRPEGAA